MGKTIITDINQLDLDKTYTLSDYMSWRFREMVELIRGKVFRMSPAPSSDHAEISGNLFLAIGSYLRSKKCKIYHAPFDVYLFPAGSTNPELESTVVQPDICVVCDPQKIVKKGCMGAPDWIIEILSPGTAKKDLNEKFKLYEKAGVQEYWIVYPLEQMVHVYTLDETGTYQASKSNPYIAEEELGVSIFPELTIDLKEVFPEDNEA